MDWQIASHFPELKTRTFFHLYLLFEYSVNLRTDISAGKLDIY
jgi:hypothetical protein